MIYNTILVLSALLLNPPQDLGPFLRAEPKAPHIPETVRKRIKPVQKPGSPMADDEMRAQFNDEDKRLARFSALYDSVLAYLERSDVKRAQAVIDEKMTYRGGSCFIAYLQVQAEVFLYQRDYRRTYDFLEPYCYASLTRIPKLYLAISALKLKEKPRGLQEFVEQIEERGRISLPPSDPGYLEQKLWHHIVLSRFYPEFLTVHAYEDFKQKNFYIEYSYLEYLYTRGQFETVCKLGSELEKRAWKAGEVGQTRRVKELYHDKIGRKNEPWVLRPFPADVDGA